MDYVDTFSDRRHDQATFQVLDNTRFYELATMLEEEEDRRDPQSTSPHDASSAMARVEQLCNTFHAVVLRLQKRRSKLEVFSVRDEYDVQDLMGALLATRFTDVRDEEWTQSHAGKSCRMDFLLKEEQVVVETKMTRDGLTDHKVGDELILDINRYKSHTDCKALFCFLYDPDHRLKNPAALEADLSRKTDGLLVRVRIRPSR